MATDDPSQFDQQPAAEVAVRRSTRSSCARVRSWLAAGTPVVVLGAPGVGKTRLAAEVGRAAADTGRPVAWIDLRNAPYETSSSLLADARSMGSPPTRRTGHPGQRRDRRRRCRVCRRRLAARRAQPAGARHEQGRGAGRWGSRAVGAAGRTRPPRVCCTMFLERLAPGVQMDDDQIARICATVGGLPLGLRLAASTAHA